MELIYLTAKRFPATTADHVYTHFLANAFSRLLGNRFTLVIAGTVPSELDGIQVYGVKMPKMFRTAYYFFWLPYFICLRSRRATDLVFFCNDFNLLVLLAFWKSFLKGRYRICSDWHLMTETWKDTYVARASDQLITTSARLKRCVIERTRVEPEKIAVIYGGVDPEPFKGPLLIGRDELGLPSGFLVGYVGMFKTMGREKGLKTMMDALALLSPEIRMIFVGGSPEEITEYSAYATTQGVADRCTFLERQTYERVVAYERNMDALVIPYPDEPHFRDYGFPMKVYEYLATGKPIIYSNLEIMNEVLAEKGVSFCPGDTRDLARAIVETRSALTLNTAEANSYGHLYSWDKKANEILLASSQGLA